MVGFPTTIGIFLLEMIFFWVWNGGTPCFLETPIYWILLSLSECLNLRTVGWKKSHLTQNEICFNSASSQAANTDVEPGLRRWPLRIPLPLSARPQRMKWRRRRSEDHQVFGLERSLGCYKHARPDSVNGTAKGSKCLFAAKRSLWTCLRRLRKQRGIEHGIVSTWAIWATIYGDDFWLIYLYSKGV